MCVPYYWRYYLYCGVGVSLWRFVLSGFGIRMLIFVHILFPPSIYYIVPRLFFFYVVRYPHSSLRSRIFLSGVFCLFFARGVSMRVFLDAANI